MCSISEYDFVASEITELEQILDTLSADRVLDRMNMEHRLQSLRKELAETDRVPHVEPSSRLENKYALVTTAMDRIVDNILSGRFGLSMRLQQQQRGTT